MIGSYPSVFAIGHKAIKGIFDGPVVVEEKVDGSQFSFGIIDGELMCRSKGKQLILDAPEAMFVEAVAAARKVAPLLTPGYIYRAEYLRKPKHNTLAYDRTPQDHLILFDVMVGDEDYMSRGAKERESGRIGLEVVPCMHEGKVASLEFFNELLERVSVLGGSKVEGVVVKNYALFTQHKKFAGKYVSERFKEIHAGEWRKGNPTSADIVNRLISEHKTPARWEKAVQHLRDLGQLEDSPRDIGKLIREVPVDVLKECEGDIKARLMKHFWPKVRRGIVAGLAEWYKQRLARGAFEEDTACRG